MSFVAKTRSRIEALSEREPYFFSPGIVPDVFRPAAVLMPFWEEAGSIRFTTIVRSSTAPTHAGQVAFPGGRIDDTDADAEAAALREAEEEVGLDPARVTIQGRLDDAWAAGRFHLVAHVGWVDEVPDIRANPAEAEKAVVAELEPLMDPAARIERTMTRNGRTWNSSAYQLPGALMTGLSADLFHELLLWLNDEPSEKGKARERELQRWVDQGMPNFFATPSPKDD